MFFSDGIKIIFPLSWVVPFLDTVVSENLFVSRVGCPFSFVAVNLGTMFSWCDNCLYYMEESVLLGTKSLLDSIRHSIRDPSGVFSVCHAFECHIVQ